MRIAAHPLSRRQFLANSARAATGLAAANLVLRPASAPGEPRRLSPNDRINIAFIGTGGRATTNIAEVTKADDVNVVALCDVDETNLKSAGERFPNAKRYRDFRKLLQMEKVLDAVFISVPDHIHAQIGRASCRERVLPTV